MDLGNGTETLNNQVTVNTGHQGPKVSFGDTLAKNNPNMVFSSYSNLMCALDEEYCTSEDEEEETNEDEDPRCPTIRLTKEKKHRIWELWENALIIKMFDEGVAFLRLQRNLKTKWKL